MSLARVKGGKVERAFLQTANYCKSPVNPTIAPTSGKRDLATCSHAHLTASPLTRPGSTMDPDPVASSSLNRVSLVGAITNHVKDTMAMVEAIAIAYLRLALCLLKNGRP